MTRINMADGGSIRKGYDLYRSNQVVYCQDGGDGGSVGEVQGTQSKPYFVRIQPEHMRRSTCTCPYARDKRKVCKHMVATFFASFPQLAEEHGEALANYIVNAEARRAELEWRILIDIEFMTLEERLKDHVNARIERDEYEQWWMLPEQKTVEAYEIISCDPTAEMTISDAILLILRRLYSLGAVWLTRSGERLSRIISK